MLGLHHRDYWTIRQAWMKSVPTINDHKAEIRFPDDGFFLNRRRTKCHSVKLTF